MRKSVSITISFLIVWALVTGICYLIGRCSGSHAFSDLSYDISLGFSSALSGVFGPVIYDYLR